MIPKKIYYPWFGGNPKPKAALECLDSWKMHMPQYEIIEINESNYDIEKCEFTLDCANHKKWAFLADYARLDVINENGGVYMDIDEFIHKPFDDIVEQGNFMSYTADVKQVESGSCFGLEKDNWLLKEVINVMSDKKLYGHKSPLKELDERLYKAEYKEGRPLFVNEHITKILVDNGFEIKNEHQDINGIHIYPSEFFIPTNVPFTENTRGEHLYLASWR